MSMCSPKTTTTSNTSQQQNTSSSYNQAQTNQYDPQALAAYQGAQQPAMNVLQGYMADPYKSGYFNNALGQAFGTASQMGQQGMQNYQANLSNRGFSYGNGGAMLAQQQAQGGRYTSFLKSQAQNSLLSNYMGMQLGAATQAQNYRPLQMGTTASGTSTGNMTGFSQGTQTQQTSGGWLPQIIGMGLGAGLGAMTGGASGALAGAMGIASPGRGGQQSAPDPYANWTPPNNSNAPMAQGQYSSDSGPGNYAGFGGGLPLGANYSPGSMLSNWGTSGYSGMPLQWGQTGYGASGLGQPWGAAAGLMQNRPQFGSPGR